MIGFICSILLIFYSSSSFSTDDQFSEENPSYKRVEFRARTVESGASKESSGSNYFDHEYLTQSFREKEQWMEDKTLSIGFHATKEKMFYGGTQTSGFQTESNTTNSRTLSYVDDPDGKIYEELVSNTVKYKGKDYNLMSANCGYYLAKLASESLLDQNIKKQLLTKTFCLNNEGIGKETIPECSKHIQKHYDELYREPLDNPFA